MDTLLHKIIASALLIPALLIGLFFPESKPPVEIKDSVGSTFQTPEARALFETSLSSKISSTATTFTLTNATDKDGNTLASSTYGFIIDEGTADEEIILADCTATACTNATRGLSSNTGTTTVSALKKAHRAGANIKITDAPLLLFVKNALKGKQNLENILTYDSALSFTVGSNQLASVLYADTLSFAGAPNGSETAKGIYELSTAAETADGVSTGSTAARLVIPTSAATSTYQGGSSNKVVVTGAQNTIDANFIATSSQYTWSGVNTHTGTDLFTASTTLTATTTILANSVNTALVLNGVDYRFPAVEGATSTSLMTNGTGSLTWNDSNGISINTKGYFVAASTTDTAVADTITETSYGAGTLATLAANTLGTNGAINIRLGVSALSDSGGNQSVTYRVKLAGTEVCRSAAILAPASALAGYVDFYLFADAATNAQRCIAYQDLTNGTLDKMASNESTSSVDTTAATAISVTATWGGNDGGDAETTTMSNVVITNFGRQ